MPRILFEKTGNAIWISHLDLMRLFQRAFKRAGLALKHTQGFNPRPSVSIALPLSVGIESHCELLDFDLDGQAVACEEICQRLNQSLINGVHVLQVYDAGSKLRDLAFLNCKITMEYDRGVPANALDDLQTLFSSESLIVPKKSKNGVIEQDIIPMIRRIEIGQAGEDTCTIDCIICCQNPTLNPMQLVEAVRLHRSDLAPDFARCSRIELFDQNDTVFR